MNIFAHIQRLKDFQFDIVKFFTVHLEEDGEEKDANEFFDFLNRMEKFEEIEDDLSNLLVWIEEIGENIGAKNTYSEMNRLQPMCKLCPLLLNKWRCMKFLLKIYDCIAWC